jgi:cytoskeletal protein CcmA (bactofilin family)
MFFNLFKKFISKNDEKILKEQVGPAVTVIAPGTEIKGEIRGQDTLRISGYLEGNINCKRMVWIDQSGKIDGNIHARRVINEGEINGNIDSAERVEIRSNGRMIGNINAAKIMIAQGCLFDGEAHILEKDDTSGSVEGHG